MASWDPESFLQDPAPGPTIQRAQLCLSLVVTLSKSQRVCGGVKRMSPVELVSPFQTTIGIAGSLPFCAPLAHACCQGLGTPLSGSVPPEWAVWLVCTQSPGAG